MNNNLMKKIIYNHVSFCLRFILACPQRTYRPEIENWKVFKRKKSGVLNTLLTAIKWKSNKMCQRNYWLYLLHTFLFMHAFHSISFRFMCKTLSLINSPFSFSSPNRNLIQMMRLLYLVRMLKVFKVKSSTIQMAVHL